MVKSLVHTTELLGSANIEDDARTIAINEAAYRRGFQHGVTAAVDVLDEGGQRDDVAKYSDDLARWRYHTPKIHMIRPPHWKGKGCW